MLQNPENVPLPTYDELAPEEHVPVNNANNEGLYDLFYNRNCLAFNASDMDKWLEDNRSTISIHKEDWSTLQGNEVRHNSTYPKYFDFTDFHSIPHSYFQVRDDENMESDLAKGVTLFKQLENTIILRQYPDSSSFSTTFHLDLELVTHVYSQEEIRTKFGKECHPQKFYIESIPLGIHKHMQNVEETPTYFTPEYIDLFTIRISNLSYALDERNIYNIWIPSETFSSLSLFETR